MPATMTPAQNDGIVRPARFGHFGIRTTPDKLDKMIEWHLAFFGARVILRTSDSAFLSWDDEHHRMVIVARPEHEQLHDRTTVATVYHLAFSLDTLADLATSYEQKKAKGIVPHWPVNHGMSTSMYYYDPDGNEFEMQVNNFPTAQAAYAFMASEEYKENPIGVDIVPEDLIKRIRSGEDEALIKKRARIGPRRTRYENSIYFQPEVKA